MGSGNNTHVDIDIAVAAKRTHFSLLQHAQQFNLQRRGHIANFIKKQRAPLSRLEQPFTAAHRAGKGAAGMAEELRLKQLFRQRATVDGNKGIFTARAGVVDRLGQDLFPGPALAVDQHANVGLRHHPRLFQQAQHHRATRHDGFTPGVVAGWRRVLKGAVDCFIEGVFIHRFGEEAEYPLLRRGHRIRNRSVSGKDNHRHPGLLLLDLREQLQAIHFIHAQIADHQIDFLAAEHFQPLLPAFSGDHAVAFADQTHPQQL